MKYKMLLLNGDCIEMMKQIPDASVDLVFTSPPYWKGFEYESYFNSYHQYLEWTKEWTHSLKRIVKPNGWFVLNISNDSETTIKAFEVMNICLKDWKLHDTIIWNVYNRQPANTTRQLTNQMEFLFVFRHKSAGAMYYKDGIAEQYPEVFGSKNVGNVWKIPFAISSHSLKKVIGGKNNWGHSGFPRTLVEIVVKLFTKEKDMILDCFAGTGSVGKMALELNRDCILIDRNEIPM